jgi:L-iditol 2-dehydrogenase
VRTVQVERGIEPQVLAEEIKRALGREAGLVLECTGVESSIHSAIYVSWKMSKEIVSLGKPLEIC